MRGATSGREEDICVIVPTIREYDCVREYVANAREHGFDTDRLHFVLVTEEFCDTAEMESMLAELGVAGEVFDGPRPHDEWDYFGRHLSNLSFEGSIESVASDERWVNVLYQNADEHGLYPRGYPYSAMGECVETEPVEVTAGEVVASQGLWTNVPDLDAVRILMDGDLEGQAQTRTDHDDFERDFVAARGNYLTVCSMNLAFRRAVIPAFYQLPMDDNEWEVGRFDDIWSGVFLKRACDVLGARIYNGEPLCAHNKAPRSTFDDLNNEVAGLELNEHVWTLVDDVGADAESYTEVYRAMADAMLECDPERYRNGEFLPYVGEHMHDWLDALAELERAPVAADD